MFLKFLCIALISVTLTQAAPASFPEFEGDGTTKGSSIVIPNFEDGDDTHDKPLEFPVTIVTPGSTEGHQTSGEVVSDSGKTDHLPEITTVSSAVTEAATTRREGILEHIGDRIRDSVKKNTDRIKHGFESIFG